MLSAAPLGAGLSLAQAPPIRVPFSFFLAAPAFAVAAGLLLAWEGDMALASRWTPAALALVHLLALGFLAQILSGALLQMLPVLGGAPVPRVVPVGLVAQALLAPGTLGLCAGFYWGNGLALAGGAGAVAAGLGLLGSAVALALARGRGARDTLIAMGLGIGALGVTLTLGLALVAAFRGRIELSGSAAWVDLHLAWGLLGFAGLTIMGVGYQVVPMFHVTPPYPSWLKTWAAPVGAAGLIVATGLAIAGLGAREAWAFAVVGLAFGAFAVVTVDRQRRRERPATDATLLHWRLAMGAALVAFALWLAGGRAETIGVLLLVGVGVGLPSGMLAKIVPFLSWFHLQHRQLAARRFDLRIPHMHALLPEAHARRQLRLHLLALGLLVTAASLPGLGLARPAGLVFAVAAGDLGLMLARCALGYRRWARKLAA